MKRFISIFLCLLLVVSVIAGCGQGNAAKEQSQDTGQKSESSAAESKSVTVYTSHPAEIVNSIIKEFQEKTRIKVDLVEAGTGELLKRIQAESGNPLGDVMWGGGAESLDAYKLYFESYKTSVDDKIPASYKDPNNTWTGFTTLPMVIMYNKKLVKESEVPDSWGSLLDPKWKGKIAYADPSASGSSYTILVTILTAYGKDDGKGWDFIRKFVKNLDGKILSGSSGVYKGVADGEYSLGLTLEESAVRYLKSGADVGIVYPKEGTSAVPDGVALIKGAKHPETAKTFIEFVLGKDVQQTMANDFYRRSVRTDIDSPGEIKPLKDIPMVDYDFTWASKYKQEVLTQWKNIVTGK